MQLAHDRTGAGEPVVLLHGITHRRQGWRLVAPLLADDYEVVAVDLPDHGDSPDLPPSYRGDTGPLADALEDFLTDAGIDRPHVVGNSLGGLLALELAARGVVRSATALSPAGFWSTPERVYARGMLAGASAVLGRMSAQRQVRVLGNLSVRRALLGALMAHPERHTAEELVAELEGLTHPRGSFPSMLGALQDWTIPAPAGVPTVVGWGDRDRLLPPHQHRRLAAALPDAEIYSLPGCGHVPMADDARMVADLVRYTTMR